MTLRADERLSRAAVRDALVEGGMGYAQAEEWCTRWEREAARQGAGRSPYFWDSGCGWIDAQQLRGKPVVTRPREVFTRQSPPISDPPPQTSPRSV